MIDKDSVQKKDLYTLEDMIYLDVQILIILIYYFKLVKNV